MGSCIWNSGQSSGVVPVMDDDTAELITRICTRIGMIMEDASLSALTLGAMERTPIPYALAELELVTVRNSALIAAAKAVSDGS